MSTYTVFQKSNMPSSCRYLCHLSMDFQHFFTLRQALCKIWDKTIGK